MTTYYAIHGENGLGIYTDYSAVMRSKEYLSKFNCKKFKNINEAKHFAISKYNNHQIDESLAIAEPDMNIKLNWTIFRNNIIAENTAKISNIKKIETVNGTAIYPWT